MVGENQSNSLNPESSKKFLIFLIKTPRPSRMFLNRCMVFYSADITFPLKTLLNALRQMVIAWSLFFMKKIDPNIRSYDNALWNASQKGWKACHHLQFTDRVSLRKKSSFFRSFARVQDSITPNLNNFSKNMTLRHGW